MTVDCPECGESFEPPSRGRRKTFCSRTCQVRNLNRRRFKGTTIGITIDEEARVLLDRAARRLVVSTRRYVELLVADHLDTLAAADAANDQPAGERS